MGLGNAFDVVAEGTVKDQTRISDRVFEQAIEVKFHNRRTEPIAIIAQDRFWRDWEIKSTSLAGKKKDAYTAEWSVYVGPDAEVVLTHTIRTGR